MNAYPPAAPSGKQIAVRDAPNWISVTAAEWRHLQPLLAWLRAPIETTPSSFTANEPTTFEMTQSLAEAFGLRIRYFHALHSWGEALTKKPFEYALEAAAKEAGLSASIAQSATTPGADIVINGQGFSVKTEAGRSISSKMVFLTKLMESAWTKNLNEPEQFVEGIKTHVLPRVLLADRTLVWRCHSRLVDAVGQVEYELLEIPRAFWAALAEVKAENFTKLTPAGSTSVAVLCEGMPAYTLSFDGSDQKLQIRNLPVSRCIAHGRWVLIPPIAASLQSL